MSTKVAGKPEGWLATISIPDHGEFHLSAITGQWSGKDERMTFILSGMFPLVQYPGACGAIEPPGATCARAAAAKFDGTVELPPWGDPDGDDDPSIIY